MIIKSQFSAKSEFYFACLEAQVNGWNRQISDKRTTHLSENTKGGIESDGVLFKDASISREKIKSFSRNEGHQHPSGNINGCIRIVNLL